MRMAIADDPPRNCPHSFLRHGDNVCFIGDSITHTGSFHSLIYLYHLTRFPGVEATLWNCGRAGGVTNQVLERYEQEITPLGPTVAALMFGLNDCGRHRYGSTHETPADHASRQAHFNEFKRRTTLLAQRLRADGCRLILQTPTPYDQTAAERPGFPEDGRVAEGHEHANDALGRFAQWLREQGPGWDAVVVDYHRPLTALTRRRQQEDPAFSMTGDRVHPEPAWHLLMAYEFLTQCGAPALMSEAHLDAHEPGSVRSSGGAVTEVCRTADELSFTWKADALPFPMDVRYEPVLGEVPFHEDLNRELLSVTGLADARYKLLIDEQPVMALTATELARGVNLATTITTPQYLQARQVMQLNERRHVLNIRVQDANMIDSWRPAGQSAAESLAAAQAAAARVDEPGQQWFANASQSYMDLHDRVEESREELREMMRKLNRLNRPVPHRYRLRRLAPGKEL